MQELVHLYTFVFHFMLMLQWMAIRTLMFNHLLHHDLRYRHHHHLTFLEQSNIPYMWFYSKIMLPCRLRSSTFTIRIQTKGSATAVMRTFHPHTLHIIWNMDGGGYGLPHILRKNIYWDKVYYPNNSQNISIKVARNFLSRPENHPTSPQDSWFLQLEK